MRLIVFALLALVFRVSGMTLAQEPPDLVVTLRDSAHRGVIATVSVRDETGQQELARATTDAGGRASFSQVQESRVRVVIDGSHSGVRLYQDGSDANGIALLLSAPPTRLDLRVDTDGRVVPDPATMIVPDQDIPRYPTAPFVAPTIAVSPIAVGTTALPRVSSTPADVPTARPIQRDPQTVGAQISPHYLLLALLWGVGVVALLLWLRRRAGWRKR
jgi:hypothetical protein